MFSSFLYCLISIASGNEIMHGSFLFLLLIMCSKYGVTDSSKTPQGDECEGRDGIRGGSGDSWESKAQEFVRFERVLRRRR